MTAGKIATGRCESWQWPELLKCAPPTLVWHWLSDFAWLYYRNHTILLYPHDLTLSALLLNSGSFLRVSIFTLLLRSFEGSRDHDGSSSREITLTSMTAGSMNKHSNTTHTTTPIIKQLNTWVKHQVRSTSTMTNLPLHVTLSRVKFNWQTVAASAAAALQAGCRTRLPDLKEMRNCESARKTPNTMTIMPTFLGVELNLAEQLRTLHLTKIRRGNMKFRGTYISAYPIFRRLTTEGSRFLMKFPVGWRDWETGHASLGEGSCFGVSDKRGGCKTDIVTSRRNSSTHFFRSLWLSSNLAIH